MRLDSSHRYSVVRSIKVYEIHIMKNDDDDDVVKCRIFD